MPCSPRLVLGIGLVLALLATDDASAGLPTDQLKQQIARVLKVLEDPELKREGKARERRWAVRRVADDFFDFGETAKRSLGRHWQSRTSAEREEFVGLFTDLLERSYLTKIELYGGENIVFIGDSIDGDQGSVRTKIITKAGSEVPVEYRVLKRGERWLVYDVVIEGVSLISNYRTQFNKIIQTSSYQELVNKMKARQEEFLDGEKQKRTSQRQ
jgi:phospholipid transport system substrate-binding protein